MSVNGIQSTNVANQLFTGQSSQQTAVSPNPETKQKRPAETPTASAKGTGPVLDQVNVSSPVTLRNLDAVKAIEQLHNKMNSLIKGVRETNESINNAAEQVNSMSSALEGITKNFPPFPLGSKERQELLMSYTSIRQEIMKMTIPPPPPPIYEKVTSMWDSIFAQNGQILPSAVPALEINSSDQQVQAALAQTEATGTNLATLSSATTQALVQA
jgi:ABC-type transporter Mla subunit MlaD